MLKTPVKFFISISLLILLMSGNSIAFHKEGNSETDIPEIEGIKKKDIQSKYCSAQVVKYTKAPENLKKEKETAEDKSEEQKTKIAEEKFYKVISYHSEEKINTSKELDFSVLKNKINKKRYIGPISSIEALLNYYCVQEIPLDGKIKIYKKGDVKLYDEIAIINGYPDRKAELEGSIYDTGKINLTIEGKSLIYSKAQFIFKEEKRLKAKEIKDEAERVAGEKKAEAERDWIARNKPTFIGKIDLKIKNFDDQIIKYNNSVNALAISHENFTKYFNEKFNEVEDLLDLVDVGQKEIKDKAIELKKVKREYLNKKILENIELKFKNIKKKKSKNFKVYKEIQVLSFISF